MLYNFKIHHDPDGLWAECIELEGCSTQADSMEELRVNMEEALNLYLDEPPNSKTIFPLPDTSFDKAKDVVDVKVDPQIAFVNILRMLRLNHHLTQMQMAKRLRFKHLYSYQRLESSKKANPELKTLAKIKEAFPEFNLDLVLSK